MQNLFEIAAACIAACNPDDKCRLTQAAADAWANGQLDSLSATDPQPIAAAGRPDKPELVAPRDLKSRKLGSREGHAALIHSITHIEFNAINLAWDAVYRFRDMPTDYFGDWIRVAREEACHFKLLRSHLRELGFDYGDFVAHNGLWEMAQKTAHDGLVRMALVPRVLEARGLDVTPAMIERLKKLGDHRAVEILDIILREEVGHVEIGTRWYRYYCQQRGLDAEETFRDLLNEYMPGAIRGPFHYAARRQAGFTETEMQMLENQNTGA